MYFDRTLQTEEDPARRARLLARQRAQARFKPQDGRGERLSGDALRRKVMLAHQVLQQMELGLIPVELRFRQDEVTFPLPLTGVADAAMPMPGAGGGNGRIVDIDSGVIGAGGGAIQAVAGQDSFASAASSSPTVSSAAFQGQGRRLGNGGGGNRFDNGDGDDGMQQAINASLRSLAAEREKRKQGGDNRASFWLKDEDDAVMPSPPKRGRAGANGNDCVIDLAGGSDDEEKKEDEDECDKKMPAKQGNLDDEVIVID